MKKFLKVSSLIILLLIVSICNAQNNKKEQKGEKIAIVLDAVENVVKDYNMRNDLIKKFNFDSSLRGSNLVKFDSIKGLTIKIQKNNNEELLILKNEFKNDNNEEIFNIGIKYLESIKKIEVVLPILFDKIHKLIIGEDFSDENIEKVNIALKNYETAKVIYKNELRDYAIKNNLY
ncbi:hypothetical protein [Flavobacterium sp. CF136]|uniref:hypothetical protein n=1 Tax=Flavobacterium sp. (strain CF136) TaxID=1144313 RepID=UPI00027196BC|nr:hypothetical protein [Flavobacterium sp. CF136]EJL62835.1 hypothetical protein PMI10_02792 [Flavobacterium sp. CF136]